MEVPILVFKALAVLASLLLTKYSLHNVIHLSHQSVVVEADTYVSSDDPDWHSPQLCQPRWSWPHPNASCSTERKHPRQLPELRGYKAIECHSSSESPSAAAGSLSCNICSCWACDICQAAGQQQICTTEALSYLSGLHQYTSSGNSIASNSSGSCAAGNEPSLINEVEVSDESISGLTSARFANVEQHAATQAHSEAVDGMHHVLHEHLTTTAADAVPPNTCHSPHERHSFLGGSSGSGKQPGTAVPQSNNRYDVGSSELLIRGQHAESSATRDAAKTLESVQPPDPAAAGTAAIAVTIAQSLQELESGDSSHGPATVDVLSAAAQGPQQLDVAEQPTTAVHAVAMSAAAEASQQLDAAEQPSTAVLAAANECHGTPALVPAQNGTAGSIAVERLENVVAGAGAPAADIQLSAWVAEQAAATDAFTMPFMTPELITKAWQQGALRPILLLLAALMVATYVCYTWARQLRQWPTARGSKGSLPLSVSKDPKQLELYFTLRKLSYQQAMWFRLLGLSGAAVLGAARVEQRCNQVVQQAQGTAKFARGLVRKHHMRLQRLHAEQLSDVQQQLQQRQEGLQHLQQQYDEAQQQHESQLLQQQQDAQQLRDAAEQQHKDELQQQKQQLAQHWQQELQQQQAKYDTLKCREKDLVSDVRNKADVIAEQRASIASLSQQLIEVKSEKAGLSSELQRVREQLVVERSRAEFILHEDQEVKGKAADVHQKCQSLMDQLSEVSSSNAQLTNELQHLQATTAAAEGTIKDLQQQLACTNSQLAAARSANADCASKLAQLEERSSNLQQQLHSTEFARDGFAGQLRELQNMHTAAEANNKVLQDKLSVSLAAAADGRASIVQLQEQQKQLQYRAVEQKDRLSELQGIYHQLQAAHTAAEASINELRGEKQANERKAEQLQQQLSSTIADLGQLRSEYAAAAAQLHQSRDIGKQQQEQLTASQAEIKQQSGQLIALQQVLQSTQQQLQSMQHQVLQTDASVEQLIGQKQQLSSRLQEVNLAVTQQQADLADKQQQIQQLSGCWQQEQARSAELQQQICSLNSAYSELEESRDLLDQDLEQCTQLLEDREEELRRVQQEKAALDTQLTAVRANLNTRNATLREAQASLSDTEGKLHEEYEKNWELGRDNMQLQQELDRLKEDNRQIDLELEEVTTDRDDVAGKLDALTTGFEILQQESTQIQNKTEGLLSQNLDSLVELEGKHTAAQAGLTAVTKERDELAKKLFWAEIARDQHGAAKNLANQEAIAARKDLLEEKLTKSRQVGGSPVPGVSGGAASAGGASGGSIAEDRPVLSRTSSRGRAWPEVKTGYLHQQFSDRPPTGRTGSSNLGHNSPRSPLNSPTPSGDSATPSPRTSRLQSSTGAVELTGSAVKCKSAPCTPRSGEAVTDTANVANSNSLVEPKQQGSAATAEPTAVSRLRKSASLPTVPIMLGGAADAVDHCDSSAAASQDSSASVAAAVKGLRSNFRDSTSAATVARNMPPAAVIAGGIPATPAGVQGHTGPPATAVASPLGTCIDGSVKKNRQQQQEQGEGSPQQASPPPLESSHSPNIASSGRTGSRGERSRGSRLDHSLLPLNLSPVPFDLMASSDLGASAASVSDALTPAGSVIATAAAGSPDIQSSGNAAVPEPGQEQGSPAVPTDPKVQQQQQDEFFTPLPVGRHAPAAAADAGVPSAASAAGTPYYTPKQQAQQQSPQAAPAGQPASPISEPAGSTLFIQPNLRRIATAPVNISSSGSLVFGSAHGPGSARSYVSMSDLAFDDEADVLIGSMTELDFAAAVRKPGPAHEPGSVGDGSTSSDLVAPVAAANGSKQHAYLEAAAGGSMQEQIAAEAAPAAARRQQQGLMNGSNDVIQEMQSQQQQQKLTKSQKKRSRQKQKRRAAAQQQRLCNGSQEPSDAVLPGLAAEPSLDSLLDSTADHNDSLHLDDVLGELLMSIDPDGRDDVPFDHAQPDSPPKMFIRGPVAAAAAAASSGSSGGTAGRYGSPLSIRGAVVTPFSASSADAAGRAASLGSYSVASSVDDIISSPIAAAANGGNGLLFPVDSGSSFTGPSSGGSSRFKGVKSNLGSPTTTSCSSIKHLVAQSRLRDGELRSSSGSSRLANAGSPQRFRSKFGMMATTSPTAAAAATVSSSNEGVIHAKLNTSLRSANLAPHAGSADQDVSHGVGPRAVTQGGFSSPSRPGGLGMRESADDVNRGSVELPYRSSVQWKALSDSVTFSPSELAGLGCKGSGAASPASAVLLAAASVGSPLVVMTDVGGATGASQDWKIADNMLYFD